MTPVKFADDIALLIDDQSEGEVELMPVDTIIDELRGERFLSIVEARGSLAERKVTIAARENHSWLSRQDHRGCVILGYSAIAQFLFFVPAMIAGMIQSFDCSETGSVRFGEGGSSGDCHYSTEGLIIGLTIGLGPFFISLAALTILKICAQRHIAEFQRETGSLLTKHDRKIRKLPHDVPQDSPVPLTLMKSFFPYLSKEGMERLHYQQIREVHKHHPSLLERKIEASDLSTEQRLTWNKIYQLQTLDVDAFLTVCQSTDFHDEINNLPYLFEGILYHLPEQLRESEDVITALVQLLKDVVLDDENCANFDDTDIKAIVNDVMRGFTLKQAIRHFGYHSDDEDSDDEDEICFNVGGRNISALKSVLMEKSPTFHAMFANGMKESEAEVVTIQEVNPDHFHEMIRFLMGKKCHIDHENCESLLQIANMYQVTDLTICCENFLLKNMHAIEQSVLLELAKKYELTSLKEALVEILILKLSSISPLSESFRQLYHMFETYEITPLKEESRRKLYECFTAWYEGVIRNRTPLTKLTEDLNPYTNIVGWLDDERKQGCNRYLNEVIAATVANSEALKQLWDSAVDHHNQWLKEGIARFCGEAIHSELARMAWIAKPDELTELMVRDAV